MNYALKHSCAGMARPMELLAPAGGMEQLECAVHFGADAVYLASKRFGMRRRAANFSNDEIAQAVRFAHANDVRVYVTANTLMRDGDVAALPDFFAMLQDAGVDAVIVSDLGALAVCKRVAPKLELHLSTQASCMNAESAKAYYELGVRRVVVAREMSLENIATMRANIPDDLEIEAFVHGAMCMAYSGRCLISDHMAGPARGANNGHCAQPCRWKYSLVEETRPGEPFTVVEEDGGSFIFSSTDMNMLSHLHELSEAGVDSIKIEGRAKGAYYVASAVNAYRHVLDGEDAGLWQAELETTSHRPYSTGFYFGAPGQNQGKKEYARDYQMVARVVAACPSAGEAEHAAPEALQPYAAGSATSESPLRFVDGCIGASAAKLDDYVQKVEARRKAIEADPYGSKTNGVSAETFARLVASPAQTYRVQVVCRNRFHEGETLEVLTPGREVFKVVPTRLVLHAPEQADTGDIERRDEGVILGANPQVPGGELCAVTVANRAMEAYSFEVDQPLCEGDILRVQRDGQCLGRVIE